MFKVFLLINSWKDYFPDFESTKSLGVNYFDEVSSSQWLGEDGNWYILDCFFNGTTSEASGGAIYCYMMGNLMVESTIFENCYSEGHLGGAIVSGLDGGGFVASKVASLGCSCKFNDVNPSYGQFCSSRLRENKPYKNCVDESSIAKSDEIVFNPQSTIDLAFGDITLKNNNITQNKINGYSAFNIENPNSCLVSFSSIRKNVASNGQIIGFNSNIDTNNNFQMKECNVIENNAIDAIVLSNGMLTISKSCFIFNTPSITFLKQSGTINLFECTTDMKVDDVATIIKTAAQPFINELLFKKCQTKKVEKLICIYDKYLQRNRFHSNVINFII